MKVVKELLFGVVLGCFAFLLVFILNWKVNLFYTSLIRGLFAFIVFTAVGIIIGFLLIPQQKQHIDVKASINDEDLFQPLHFPKIENEDEIEKYVNGIRNLSQDE
ncbi:hypothetical protein [Tepidibacillus sp. HK-1]|uniref:hypothetical protein n=1 Tax=Tepidibacillus sp. HK-1 TaxID=1883407 RepID=UPI000852B291|nr:hypothetical protein [Tepidibacillus sp. HK-1]GBF11626.1 hypothetical protein HK1_01664 [Tepidibacillus sp. HK-1]